MADQLIPGLHIVEHTGSPSRPWDPSKPWSLRMELRPPGFMQVTFVLLYGGQERIVVQGDTRESLEQLIHLNQFLSHPRLVKLTLSGPSGVVFEQVGRKPPPSASPVDDRSVG